MPRLISVGILGIALGLLTSCGDSSLQELQRHPLANPNVTVMEPTRQTATSGDISTGVLNGSSNVNSVTTAYDHDDTPEQRDRIVEEIIDHAEQLGCEVSLFSNQEGLPYGQYSIGCEGFGPVSIRMLVSPSRVSLNLTGSA